MSSFYQAMDKFEINNKKDANKISSIFEYLLDNNEFMEWGTSFSDVSPEKNTQ